MLPDLPNLKRDLQSRFDVYLHKQANARLGIFNESPRRLIREGDRLRVVRFDGTVEESTLHHSGAEMTVSLQDVPELSIEQRLQKLDEMAEQLARQMSAKLFASLSQTLDKAGQTIDRKNQPFDAEAFFAMLERLEMEFDQKGNPNISIVIPPALLPRVRALEEQFKADPELQRRHLEIMATKKRSWRAREASRKLVG